MKQKRAFAFLALTLVWGVAASAAAQPVRQVKPQPIKKGFPLQVAPAKARITPLATPTPEVKKSTTPPANAPIISAEKPEFGWGTVAQGEEVKHVFVVKNKGKSLLKIERARGG